MNLIECQACGQTIVAGSARCWRCGSATNKSLRASAAASASQSGLSGAASAVIIIAVYAVALFGLVVFVQREDAMAQHEAGRARNAAAASARAEAERQAAELERRIASKPSATAIPSDAAGSYTVREGDSLFEIAAAFGISPRALREWNQNEYPSMVTGIAVQPGWVLTLVGPVVEAPPPPPPDPVLPPGTEFVAAGGIALIDADDVVVRTRPSRGTDSRIIGSLDTGTRVDVLAGPVPASGYFWYQVRAPALEGWIAAGTAIDPWIVAAGPAAPITAGNAAIPAQTASIAGATIRYYDITGVSHWDLIQQALDLGPDTEWDDVVASVRIDFTYTPYLAIETTAQGTTSWPACDVGTSFEVILPRWVGPVPTDPAVAAWWTTAFALSRDHEARHVQIWQEHLPALLATTGPNAVDDDCSQAQQLAQYWLEAVGVVHEEFEMDEILAGRTWPPPYTAP